jgi:hypothetical protein
MQKAQDGQFIIPSQFNSFTSYYSQSILFLGHVKSMSEADFVSSQD